MKPHRVRPPKRRRASLRRESEIKIATGAKGTGKTLVLATWVRTARRPALALDPTGSLAEALGTRAVDVGELAAAIGHPPDPCVVAVRDHRAADALIAWAMRRGEVMIAIDEVDRWAHAGRCPPALRELLHRSRHYRCDVAMTSQRLAGLPPIITTSADVLAMFRTRSPSDLDRIARIAGKEVASRVRTLQRFEYLLTE